MAGRSDIAGGIRSISSGVARPGVADAEGLGPPTKLGLGHGLRDVRDRPAAAELLGPVRGQQLWQLETGAVGPGPPSTAQFSGGVVHRLPRSSSATATATTGASSSRSAIACPTVWRSSVSNRTAAPSESGATVYRTGSSTTTGMTRSVFASYSANPG